MRHPGKQAHHESSVCLQDCEIAAPYDNQATEAMMASPGEVPASAPGTMLGLKHARFAINFHPLFRGRRPSLVPDAPAVQNRRLGHFAQPNASILSRS
jgi:hypothetical protein